MASISSSPALIRSSLDIPPHIHSPCDLMQALMKLQRAAQLIASTFDLDLLLQRVVTDLAAAIGCVEIAVWLRDPESEEMVLGGVRGCTKHAKGARLKIGSRGMVSRTALTGRMRYAADVRLEPDYIACEPDIRAEVDIPLMSGANVIGVLCISHKRTHAFSDDQLQMLQALAGHVVVAVENARLIQRERSERQRMQREAEEASAVQKSLFGNSVPLVPNFAFETAWRPAQILAGDWFDFIPLGNERYGIVLADVAGKGMSAALLMSATRALVRSTARSSASPGETLARLNQTIIEDFPPGKFVTMIYCVLDAGSREITIASAGHPRPLLVNGHCAFVDVDPGLPLGLRTSSYAEVKLELPVGHSLLLYTDGITEAMNDGDEEYGPARLVRHFLQPEACIEGLLTEVGRFSSRSTFADDATAVLVRSR